MNANHARFRTGDFRIFTNCLASDRAAIVQSTEVFVIANGRLVDTVAVGAANIIGARIVVVTIGRATGSLGNTNPIAKFLSAGANALPCRRHTLGGRRQTNDGVFMPAIISVRSTRQIDTHLGSVAFVAIILASDRGPLHAFALRITGLGPTASALVVAIGIRQAIQAGIVLAFFIRWAQILVLTFPVRARFYFAIFIRTILRQTTLAVDKALVACIAPSGAILANTLPIGFRTFLVRIRTDDPFLNTTCRPCGAGHVVFRACHMIVAIFLRGAIVFANAAIANVSGATVIITAIGRTASVLRDTITFTGLLPRRTFANARCRVAIRERRIANNRIARLALTGQFIANIESLTQVSVNGPFGTFGGPTAATPVRTHFIFQTAQHLAPGPVSFGRRRLTHPELRRIRIQITQRFLARIPGRRTIRITQTLASGSVVDAVTAALITTVGRTSIQIPAVMRRSARLIATAAFANLPVPAEKGSLAGSSVVGILRRTIRRAIARARIIQIAKVRRIFGQTYLCVRLKSVVHTGSASVAGILFLAYRRSRAACCPLRHRAFHSRTQLLHTRVHRARISG